VRQLARAFHCQPANSALEQGLLALGSAMKAFFVQIKCELGAAYKVAMALADAEIASEIYSTAGDYDLLVKFYVEPDVDIGHFVNEKLHVIPGLRDTHTIITFRAF
jgi:DNA-binding Lrp family transcriptional regulator